MLANHVFSIIIIIASPLSLAIPLKVPVPFRGEPTDIKSFTDTQTHRVADPQPKSQHATSAQNQIIQFLTPLKQRRQTQTSNEKQSQKNAAAMGDMSFPSLSGDSKDSMYFDVEFYPEKKRRGATSGPYIATFEAHDDNHVGSLSRHDHRSRREIDLSLAPNPAVPNSAEDLDEGVGPVYNGKHQGRNYRRSLFELTIPLWKRDETLPPPGDELELGSTSPIQGRNKPPERDNRYGWGDGTQENANVVYRKEKRQTGDSGKGGTYLTQLVSLESQQTSQVNGKGRSYSPGNFALDIDGYRVAYGRDVNQPWDSQRKRHAESLSPLNQPNVQTNADGRTYTSGHLALEVDPQQSRQMGVYLVKNSKSKGRELILKKRDAKARPQDQALQSSSAGHFELFIDGHKSQRARNPNNQARGYGVTPAFDLTIEPNEERSRGTTQKVPPRTLSRRSRMAGEPHALESPSETGDSQGATTVRANTENQGGTLRQLFSVGRRAPGPGGDDDGWLWKITTAGLAPGKGNGKKKTTPLFGLGLVDAIPADSYFDKLVSNEYL